MNSLNLNQICTVCERKSNKTRGVEKSAKKKSFGRVLFAFCSLEGFPKMGNIPGFLLFLIFLAIFVSCKDESYILVEDYDDLKSLLRTKNNVLAYYFKKGSDVTPLMKKVAVNVFGIATIIFINCDSSQKLCKKMKADPQPFTLKHYANGEFSKDYDRKVSEASIVSFLKNPMAEGPWNEDPVLRDVVHVDGEDDFVKLMEKKKPTLVLFYTPMCPHCKNVKSDFGNVATDAKTQKLDRILAAVDMSNPGNRKIAEVYQISAYPSLHFFDLGTDLYPYLGAKDKTALLSWIKEPSNPWAVKVKRSEDLDWNEDPGTVLEHVDERKLDAFLAKNPNSLIVFHAKWCSHCKKIRPIIEEFVEIAEKRKYQLKVAAIDGDKNPHVLQLHVVPGYPTLRYYEYGMKKFDISERTLDGLLRWGKEPSNEPEAAKTWDLTGTKIVELTIKNAENVLKQYRNAFVLYYTPWCSHCKTMKNEFVEFAKLLKNEPNLVIAAADCNKYAGLCRQHEIGAYPSMKYFRSGKMNHQYKEGRGRHQLRDFLWLKIREEEEEYAEKSKKKAEKTKTPRQVEENTEREERKAAEKRFQDEMFKGKDEL